MTGRLSAATLAALPADIARPAYDRAAQAIGIVHLGLGAFHRAHQATYTDAALAGGDRDWAIAAASLRSTAPRDALAAQDGLYSVTTRGPAGDRTAVVGALARAVAVVDEPDAVPELLAAPATRVATLTVTEKGYLLRADGTLDLAAARAAGTSIYHLLGAGLARRRAAGLGGLTILSCDNLADNGPRLRAALGAWLDATDAGLATWFAAECACPATMVDRIVPAPTPADLARAAARLGMADAGAVATEPFHQWVVADGFAGPRPRWELAGARFVAAVAPYEAAKLRMLNGAHSALAYLGLAAGHAFVHEAVADPAIRPVVEALMAEAAAGLDPAPGQDLAAYAAALVARFANPALPHRLAQIAADGSQKVGPRWLASLAANARRGRACPATLAALAAWVRHVGGDGAPVDDPLAARLRALWVAEGADGIVDALFGPGGLLAGAHPLPETARAALRVAVGGSRPDLG